MNALFIRKSLFGFVFLVASIASWAQSESSYALIIKGSPEQETLNATRLAYQTYMHIGVPKENILVIAHPYGFGDQEDFDEEGQIDPVWRLSEDAIELALKEIGSEIGEKDTLYIYVASHGSRTKKDSFVYLFPARTMSVVPIELTGAQLDELVGKYIFQSVKKIVLVQACKSGGFVDNFVQNNSIVISSSRKHVSYRGIIQGKAYPKFSYYFFKSLERFTLDNPLDISYSEVVIEAQKLNHPINPLHKILFGIGIAGDDEPYVRLNLN